VHEGVLQGVIRVIGSKEAGYCRWQSAQRHSIAMHTIPVAKATARVETMTIVHVVTFLLFNNSNENSVSVKSQRNRVAIILDNNNIAFKGSRMAFDFKCYLKSVARITGPKIIGDGVR